MEQLLETFILRINITIHEDSPFYKLDSSLYNGQSLVSTCDVFFLAMAYFSIAMMMVN